MELNDLESLSGRCFPVVHREKHLLETTPVAEDRKQKANVSFPCTFRPRIYNSSILNLRLKYWHVSLLNCLFYRKNIVLSSGVSLKIDSITCGNVNIWGLLCCITLHFLEKLDRREFIGSFR